MVRDGTDTGTGLAARLMEGLEGLDTALVLWDAELGLEFANRRAEALLCPNGDPGLTPGRSADAVMQGLLADGCVRAPTGRDALLAQWRAVLDGQAPEMTLELASGTALKATAQPLAAGGAMLSLQDVTEERRLALASGTSRDKIARANARLKDAVESIAEGFALYDKHDTMILANHAYREANPASAHLMTFGRPRAEIVQAMAEGGDLLGVESWPEDYARAQAEGQTTAPHRYELRHRDGRVFSVSREPTAEGGCAAIWLDITDRVRGMEASEQANRRLRDALESIEQGFALYDEHSRLVLSNGAYRNANPATAHLMTPGRPRREILDGVRTSGEFTIATDWAKEFDARKAKGTEMMPANFEAVRSDGRVFVASTRPTAEGGVSVTMSDITDRVHSEAAAKRAHERLIDALESIEQAFALYDKDDKLILCNSAYMDVHPSIADRLTPGRARGEVLEGIIAGGDILGVDGWLAAYDAQVAQGCTNRPMRFEVRHRDGRIFAGSRRPTAEGGCALTLTDVTELGRSEAAAKRAHERLIDALESIEEAFVLYDGDDKLLLCNSAYLSVSPSTAPLMTPGRDKREIVAALSDRADVQGSTGLLADYDREVAEGRQMDPLRYEMTSAEGRVFQVSRRPTKEGGNSITATDITAAKETEARARALANDAMEALEEGFALFDADQRFLFCNEKYKKNAFGGLDYHPEPGTTATEISGVLYDAGVFDLDPAMTRQAFVDAITRAANTYQKGLVTQLADGRITEASVHKTGLGGYLVTSIDVTERRKAEEKAREMVYDAMESLDEGFSLWDSEMRFQMCNQRHVDITVPFRDGPYAPGTPAEEAMREAYRSGVYDLPEGLTEDGYAEMILAWAQTFGSKREIRFKDGRTVIITSHRTEMGGFLLTSVDVTDSKRAAEADAARWRSITDLVESLDEGVSLWDQDMRFLMCNDQYLRDVLTHRDTPPAVGTQGADEMRASFRSGQNVLPEDMTEDAFVDYYMDWARSYAGAVEARYKDGRVVVVTSKQTELGGVLITTKDVTEERNSEARARDMLRDAFEALDIGLVLTDENMNYVFGNDTWKDMLFRGREHLLPKPGDSVMSNVVALIQDGVYKIPEGMSDEAYLNWMMQGISEFGKGVELAATDGRYWNCASHLTSFGGALLSVEDVTAQKLAEEARAQAAQRELTAVTNAIQALGDAIIVLDADLKFVLGNERFLNFGGGWVHPPTPGEHILEITERFIGAGYFPSVETLGRDGFFERVDREIRKYVKSYELQTQFGVVSCSVHPTGEGGYLIEFKDITEQRRAEAEVARQREMAHQNEKLSAMGELLAGVAHELNNPLSIVVGYAMMLQDAVTDPVAAKQVDYVAQAAERCGRIVKAFLAMARQRPMQLERCSLNELMLAALDMAGHRLRAGGIEVTLELDPDLPEVDADQDQIIQVFVNLLANAEHALVGHRGPRQLILRTARDPSGDFALASAIDTGPGIDPKVLPRIFEPFFTTKEVGSGTGIGLAFSHRIVASHGGEMRVRSQLGKGAEFRVRLKLSAAPPALSVPTEIEGPAQGAPVLVLDDEVGVALLIQDVLEEAGYRVTVCHEGKEALRKALSTDFAAILSDVKMPGMSGPEFYAALKKADPALCDRIAFITGDTLTKAVHQFLRACGRPYLEKPVTPAELLELAARLTEPHTPTKTQQGAPAHG